MCELPNKALLFTHFRINLCNLITMATQTTIGRADDESDEYLIELIGLKEDFPVEALAAYGKFYDRYWQIMLKIALGKTKDMPEAEDLTADTFAMVYRRAAGFRKGDAKKPAEIKLALLKWMTTIMQHIFYDDYLDDAYKSNAGEESEDSHIIKVVSVAKHIDDGYDEFLDGFDNEQMPEHLEDIAADSNNTETANLEKIRAYIEKLPDRERDIVLTVYDYHLPGKYTPAAVLQTLELRWGTTKDNIRKILQKFRNSIKEELQPQMFIRK